MMIRLIEPARAAGVDGSSSFPPRAKATTPFSDVSDHSIETHPLWPASHYGARRKAALEAFVHSYGRSGTATRSVALATDRNPRRLAHPPQAVSGSTWSRPWHEAKRWNSPYRWRKGEVHASRRHAARYFKALSSWSCRGQAIHFGQASQLLRPVKSLGVPRWRMA